MTGFVKFIRVGPIGPAPRPSACISLRRCGAPCRFRLEASERSAQSVGDSAVDGIPALRALKHDGCYAVILVSLDAHILTEILGAYHRRVLEGPRSPVHSGAYAALVGRSCRAVNTVA
jgi:hypothetical protein